MDAKMAAGQVQAIWAQLARTACFRGYRPWTVGSTGLLGVIAACLQAVLIPVPIDNLDAYVMLWLGVAGVSVVITGLELAFSYRTNDSAWERRLARQAVGQFVPCLVAGAAITWVITTYFWNAAELLPGLWALCFALGVFASRPYLTHEVAWIAAHYLLAGVVAISLAHTPWAFHPLVMGITFGGGQLAMAWVLARGEARGDEESIDG